MNTFIREVLIFKWQNQNNPGSGSNAGTSTGRRSRNTYITKSGQTIKLNRNMSQRMKGLKDTWKQHKAAQTCRHA